MLGISVDELLRMNTSTVKRGEFRLLHRGYLGQKDVVIHLSPIEVIRILNCLTTDSTIRGRVAFGGWLSGAAIRVEGSFFEGAIKFGIDPQFRLWRSTPAIHDGDGLVMPALRAMIIKDFGVPIKPDE